MIHAILVATLALVASGCSSVFGDSLSEDDLLREPISGTIDAHEFGLGSAHVYADGSAYVVTLRNYPWPCGRTLDVVPPRTPKATTPPILVSFAMAEGRVGVRQVEFLDDHAATIQVGTGKDSRVANPVTQGIVRFDTFTVAPSAGMRGSLRFLTTFGEVGGAFQATFCDPSRVPCGNGLVELQEAEECDDGRLNNSDRTPDVCRTSCLWPTCGDGVVDTGFGEACDPKAPETPPCTATCELAPT